MPCTKSPLHTKAGLKKVTGAPEVPQALAVHEEAGIKHQGFLQEQGGADTHEDPSLPAE